MRALRQVDLALDLSILSIVFLLSGFLGILPKTNALILYSGSNSANMSAPDTERVVIFNAVAKVTNASGSGITGSAVYLKGKYLLTANHVNVNNRYVTFDNTTLYAIDQEFNPIRIESADMKLIKLVEDPNLPDTPIYTQIDSEPNQNATLIGWGFGRDPNQANQTGYTRVWNWGGSSTASKRWGTNQVANATYQNAFSGYNYNYHCIQITLDPSGGTNEAGLAKFDSGSGLFIEHLGEWKLAGVATLVSTADSSTFGSVFNRDTNTYVQISEYWETIQSHLPDTSTYAGWLVDNSLYGSESDYQSDTDGDGISQILEYAFQTNPNHPEPERAPNYFIGSTNAVDYFKYSLTRPSSLNNVSYSILTSTDLSNWENDPNHITLESSQIHSDGTITEIYRRSAPIADSPKGFIRLQITLE